MLAVLGATPPAISGVSRESVVALALATSTSPTASRGAAYHGAMQDLRDASSPAILAALANLGEAWSAEVEREVIALAFGHVDDGVRKAAMKLVDKRMPDARKLRATLKPSFRDAPEHEAAARLRALERGDRGKLATALVAYGTHGHGVAFDEDPEFAHRFVHELLRPAEKTLCLTECASINRKDGKDVILTTIPDAVFDELPTLRATCAFDALSMHGAPLTTLPARFAELAPFLRRLELFYVDFARVPDVLYECTNLEELALCSFTLSDLGQIDKLRKLKKLQLHECKRLKALPDAVFELPSLESLELGFTPMRSLPPAIGKAKKLRHLGFQSGQIGKLPKELAGCPLESMNIRWSKVERAAVRAILPGAKIEG